MNEDFKILQKTYDMRLYAHICLKQFPKHEKHDMVSDIKQSMHELTKLIIRANKRYHKKNTLQEIDIELDFLRMQIRLAADQQLRYLSIKKYEHWSKLLNEIGRMLGGWIKSSR